MRITLQKIEDGIWARISKTGIFNAMPDKEYICMRYWMVFKRRLNLEDPQTYTEKLQWIKLYDRNPFYTMLVDKAAVKAYVAEKIGAEHVIPTLGVWDSFDEIDFGALPEQFVLKCTHDSGSVFICKDKSALDTALVRRKIMRSLRRKYFFSGREWPYKNVKPRIIAEPYLGSREAVPTDYKFFCFDGKADNVMLCLDRASGHPRFVHMDMNWERLYYQRIEPEIGSLEKPPQFDEMRKIAETLAAGLRQIRIDMYCIGDAVYFGEYTFFDQSGLDTDITFETDKKWGALIRLDPVSASSVGVAPPVDRLS